MKQIAVVVALLLALPLPAQVAGWTVLAPGIAAGPPFTVPLRTAHGPMVMRYYAVGYGTARNIVTPGCAKMTLEAGYVITTIAGVKKPRLPGDLWTVDRGTPITFENPIPDAPAIIHVTSFDTQP